MTDENWTKERPTKPGWYRASRGTERAFTRVEVKFSGVLHCQISKTGFQPWQPLSYFDWWSPEPEVFPPLPGERDPCPRCKGTGKMKTVDPVNERGFDPDGTAYAAYARHSGPTEPCTRCAGTGTVEKGGKDHHFGKL